MEKTLPERTYKPTLILFLLRLVLVIGIAIAASCDRHGQPATLLTEQNAKGVLYDIPDDSLSNRENLASALKEVGGLASRIDCESTFLTIIRTNSNAEEVFGSPFPARPGNLFVQVVPKLRSLSKEEGTRLDIPLAEVADRATSVKGRVVVLLHTDYACEGADHAAIKRAAMKLAANEHVQAVFVEGFDANNMAQLRKDFQPLSGKYQVVSAGKLDLNLIASLLSGGAK